MADKSKIKVLTGVLVVGLDTVGNGGEAVIDAAEAATLADVGIVEILGPAPSKGGKGKEDL